MVGKSWVWCYDELVDRKSLENEGLVFKFDFNKAHDDFDWRFLRSLEYFYGYKSGQSKANSCFFADELCN